MIATLVITGLATVAVGMVPTYDQIGIWAALIMIALRFIQGVGVGGEWGGSVLMSMEWAQTNANRGFIASWPQFGGPAGIALANLAVLVFSWISGDQFLVWGWRIPFLTQHRDGRGRALYPARRPRNAGVRGNGGEGASRRPHPCSRC